MSVGLRDELFVLKTKLELLEKELTDQMMELEVKAEKWAQIDEEAEKIIKDNKNLNIFVDVGGQKYQTRLDSLLSIKDTLFYRLILSKKVDINKEIFIDRDYKYFFVILSFLRNKKVNLNSFSTKELAEIKEEAEFYQLSDLTANIDETMSEVYYLSFEVNGNYNSGGVIAGTQKIEDLNDFEDRTCMKGICAISPGWIILELNRETEFDEVEVGGWQGNTGIWASTNGNGARILTSINKSNWVDVGTVGSNLSTITKQKLTKSKAKWIKIQGTGYTGIGYFKISKLEI